MNIPITQSKAWQKLQDDLGETSFFVENPDFQYLAILKKTPVGNYLYLPYGPVAKNKTSFNRALKALQALAKENSAIFIRVEPQLAGSAKFLPSTAKKSTDLNPKETWVLDLTGNDDDLKQKLPSRLLRYHKNASKKGITIEISHDPADIHYLLDLQKALASKKGINTFSENYLKTELKQPFATLYLVRYCNNDADEQLNQGSHRYADVEAEHDGENCEVRPRRGDVVAAGLVFDDKTTRYNLQGAQSEQGRKLHATGILTIQLILDAKAKNLQTFDFWGIAPEGAPDSHPWKGFTKFKQSFGGTPVEYAGTYDIVLKPIKYHFYQLIRRLNRFIRRH
ncbi:peptidoglycan bridge formation glycyltransferase FemA/FemB family protein [Candidatus Saccharibacteria bacterium]|nr:peptidoglycan bridge formation glycyltransferase FemA/FemB family protein [Candidatus Saccharibacteria bacterium]